jgi:hypothetical protein
MRKKPRIGVLLGDPTGIGPELVAKLLVLPETSDAAEVVIVGDADIYRRGAQIAGAEQVSTEFIEYSSGDDYPLGQVSAAGGAYALASLKVALEKLEAGIVDAIVYAPLNKQAMKLAGMAYEDELHYFASMLRYTGTVSEINACGNLWTSRVTSHIPLSGVAGSITIDKICSVAHCAGSGSPPERWPGRDRSMAGRYTFHCSHARRLRRRRHDVPRSRSDRIETARIRPGCHGGWRPAGRDNDSGAWHSLQHRRQRRCGCGRDARSVQDRLPYGSCRASCFRRIMQS